MPITKILFLSKGEKPPIKLFLIVIKEHNKE